MSYLQNEEIETTSFKTFEPSNVSPTHTFHYSHLIHGSGGGDDGRVAAFV